MKYKYKDAKTKFRKCAAIGLQELNDSAKNREVVTELAMLSGYVGYMDIEDFGLRIYAFTDAESAKKLIREAKKIGLRTAGEVVGSLSLKNTDLERPHLKYMPRDTFFRELYK